MTSLPSTSRKLNPRTESHRIRGETRVVTVLLPVVVNVEVTEVTAVEETLDVTVDVALVRAQPSKLPRRKDTIAEFSKSAELSHVTPFDWTAKNPSNVQASGIFSRDPGPLNSKDTRRSAAAMTSHWFEDRMALKVGDNGTHVGTATDVSEQPLITSIRTGICSEHVPGGPIPIKELFCPVELQTSLDNTKVVTVVVALDVPVEDTEVEIELENVLVAVLVTVLVSVVVALVEAVDDRVVETVDVCVVTWQRMNEPAKYPVKASDNRKTEPLHPCPECTITPPEPQEKLATCGLRMKNSRTITFRAAAAATQLDDDKTPVTLEH